MNAYFIILLPKLASVDFDLKNLILFKFGLNFYPAFLVLDLDCKK